MKASYRNQKHQKPTYIKCFNTSDLGHGYILIFLGNMSRNKNIMIHKDVAGLKLKEHE